MNPGAEGRFLITACLDKVDIGIIPRVPRHLTVVPWSTIPLEEIDRLKMALAEVAKTHDELMIVGAGEATFGDESEIRVRLLESDPEIQDLHEDCLAAVVACHGLVRRWQFVSDGYTPHVSKQADGWLDRGERIVLPRLQLVQAIESSQGKRDIIAQFNLQERNETAA